MEWLRVSRRRQRLGRYVRLTLLGLLPLGPIVEEERYRWYGPSELLPFVVRRWQRIRWGAELPWWRACLVLADIGSLARHVGRNRDRREALAERRTRLA